VILSHLGEFGLIHRFKKLTPKSSSVVIGIGDDCAAVLPPAKGSLMLLTCDPVIENVHFLSSARPQDIGWKVMCRNISDIAAMGGIPKYALVSASLPRKTPVARALGIYRGLSQAAKKYGVQIVGGDTSHDEKGIHIGVTLIGEVPKSQIVTRGGARPGDAVFVTGGLGGSIEGKHLRFEPRIKEARLLAEKVHPSSMMDLSDGLASDLKRLAEESGVGFEIWADAIPVSDALRRKKFPFVKQIARAMRDGEDYELLFTVPAKKKSQLVNLWGKRFRLKLTEIGVVTKLKKIQLVRNSSDRRLLSLPQAGNDHFRV
jgi:thiamine-monophosphate kinase